MSEAIAEAAATEVACKANDRLGGNEPVGFDYTLLIEILIEILGNCLMKASRTRVERALTEDDFWARYYRNRAVKTTARRSGIRISSQQQIGIAEALRDTLQANPEHISAFLGEIEQNYTPPDYTLI